MDHPEKKRGIPVFSYFSNSFHELRKVTWPTKSQAINMTILVILITIVTAAFIALLDFGFTWGYEQLITHFGTAQSVTTTPTTIPVGDTGTTKTVTIPASPEGAAPTQ